MRCNITLKIPQCHFDDTSMTFKLELQMYLFLIILNVKCQEVFTISNLTAVQICYVIKFKLERTIYSWHLNCYQLMQQLV